MANLFDVPHDPDNLRELPVGRYTIGRNVSLRVRYIAVKSGQLAKYAAWYHRYRAEDGKQRERNLGSAATFALEDAIAFRDSLPSSRAPQPQPAQPGGARFLRTTHGEHDARMLAGSRHGVAIRPDGYVFFTLAEDGTTASETAPWRPGLPLGAALQVLEDRATRELV